MIAIMFDPFVSTLAELADKELMLADGQRLFRVGAPVRNIYVVREGCMKLLRLQRDGFCLALQRATAGHLLAEASIFASNYHCDAAADGAATVLRVPRERVDELRSRDPNWVASLAQRLAVEVQRARTRAELLSFKRVDQRLEGWLILTGGVLPSKGEWVGLALELGVSPEALYRELARKRRLNA